MLVTGFVGNGTTDHASSRCLEIKRILTAIGLPSASQLVLVTTAHIHHRRANGTVPTLDTSFHMKSLIAVLFGSDPLAPTTRNKQKKQMLANEVYSQTSCILPEVGFGATSFRPLRCGIEGTQLVDILVVGQLKALALQSHVLAVGTVVAFEQHFELSNFGLNLKEFALSGRVIIACFFGLLHELCGKLVIFKRDRR